MNVSHPFKTGAIEVSIATMCKGERCPTDEVYVVGFVPSFLLPCKRSISLDPFLDPLIREIEGFIHGNCHFMLSCISALLVNTTIRAAALLVYYFFYADQCV